MILTDSSDLLCAVSINSSNTLRAVSVVILCRSNSSPNLKWPRFNFCSVLFWIPFFRCDEPSSASILPSCSGDSSIEGSVNSGKFSGLLPWLNGRGALDSVVGGVLSGVTPVICSRNRCSSFGPYFCFLTTFHPFPRFGTNPKSVQYRP